MSTVLEVLPLEGVDLEGSPPCECMLSNGHICGKPSDYRLISSCGGCLNTVTGFACAPCWDYIRPYINPRDWMCRWCGAVRVVRVS